MSELITRLRDNDVALSLTKEQRSMIQDIVLAYERDVILAATRFGLQRILTADKGLAIDQNKVQYARGMLELVNYIESRYGIVKRTKGDKRNDWLEEVREELLQISQDDVDRDRTKRVYFDGVRGEVPPDDDDAAWDDIEEDELEWDNL